MSLVRALAALFFLFAVSAQGALVYSETLRDETTIWRADGKERAPLFRIAHAEAWNPTVSLSPDGRHAAILAVTEGSLARATATAVIVADLASGEARVIDHDADVHVAAVWINDDAFAYVRRGEVVEATLSGEPRVAASFQATVVMPIRGNDTKHLRDVVWYVGSLEGHRLVSIDSGAVRELRTLDEVPYDARLSQDGTHLEFTSRRRGRADQTVELDLLSGAAVRSRAEAQEAHGIESRGWIQIVAHRDAVTPAKAGFFDAREKGALRAMAVCAQPVAYGYQPYPNELTGTFDQASHNQLGSAGPAISSITKGVAPTATSVPFSIPPSIIKAVGYAEAWQIWKQFNTAYGTYGYTGMSQSGDCGYGVMQITYGMSGGAGYDPVRVASDLTYNIGTGALFLRNGWQSSGVIGDRNPAVYEHWYHAVMRYNGVMDVNNPANPIYANPFPAYNGSNRTALPYQEVVWSLIRNPYAANALYNGQPLWEVVAVTSPPRSWYPFPLTAMPNTPSPTPVHAESAQLPPAPTGTGFYTIAPCRLADSRSTSILGAWATRTILAAGACGIPASAKSIAINLTAIAPAAGGSLRVTPAGTAPDIISMYYRTGKTRASSSLATVSAGGAIDVYNGGASPVHFVIDVTGYFQ